MLESVCPKLPMRNKNTTRDFYITKLQFEDTGAHDFPAYLMLRKGNVELHFFLFEELDVSQNYGQVYIRTNDIDKLYSWFIAREIPIHPNGRLSLKPWQQKEFAVLDPDNNLLTFGEAQ